MKKESARSRKNKIKQLSQNPYCSLCGQLIESVAEASWDHVIPRSKGGEDSAQNLALAHVWCNGEKSDLSRWVYRFFRFLNSTLYKVKPGRPSKRLYSHDRRRDDDN